MSLNSVRGLSDLQQTIHRVQSGERYEQAAIDEQVEKAYDHYAHDPAVRLEYGNLCLRRKDLAKSRTIATELIEAQPQNVRAMNLLARVMMKEGQSAEAVTLLEKANALSPLNTERLLLLGGAFYKVGALDKAADCYNQASDLDPHNKQAQKGLAQVKLSEGDLNTALDLLRNSASEEEAAALFNNAAVLATRSGRHRESLKLYEAALKALKSNALKAAVYFNTSLTLERLGRHEDALKAINRALKYDSTFDKANRQRRRLEEFVSQKLAPKSA
jgi:tetratricopeptide (TPR) repeat protein